MKFGVYLIIFSQLVSKMVALAALSFVFEIHESRLINYFCRCFWRGSWEAGGKWKERGAGQNFVAFKFRPYFLKFHCGFSSAFHVLQDNLSGVICLPAHAKGRCFEIVHTACC